MSTIYMITWSTILIFAVGIGRIKDVRQTVGVAAIAAFILILTQTLAAQLAHSVGLDIGLIFSSPEQFFLRGPIGWLALLVMPCGWLGPIIGMNYVFGRNEHTQRERFS